MRSISSKRKFNGEVFTLRESGGYHIHKKDAIHTANFIRSLGKKKVRIVSTSPHGYLIYEKNK